MKLLNTYCTNFLLFLTLSCLSIGALAQEKNTGFSLYRDWALGINAGPNLFIGDLPFAGTSMRNYKLGYSFFVQKQLNNWLSVRAQALNGKLAGSGTYYDSDLMANGVAAFSANVFEYNLSLAFDVSYLFNGYNPERVLQLYGLAGGGFSNWKTSSYNIETGVVVGGNGSGSGNGINGRTLEPVIPLGMGLNWRVNDFMKLHAETSLRTVKSDIQDGIPGGFKYDMSWYTGAGVTFGFDVKGNKKIPLINYTADADKLPVKYKDMALDISGKKTLKSGAMPEITFTVPKRISDEESFQIKIIVKNDGASGIADLEIVIPDGFDISDPGIIGFVFTKKGQVINLLNSLPAHDTTIAFNVNVASAKAPVGSYPFYFSSKFTDIAGESTKMKFVDYIEKDLMYNNLSEGGSFKLGVEFRIQLTSSKGIQIPENKLKALYPVEGTILEDFQDGYYQYTTGSFNKLADAENYRDKLKNDLGTNDLYVVFFQNGTRISTFKAAENSNLYMRESATAKTASSTNQHTGIDEFRIEIKRSQNVRISVSEIISRFETPEPLVEDYKDGWYSIYAGSFKRKDVASAYMKYLSTQYGFAEMKVIAFSRGKRLD
jgi:hypothetical protein